MKKKYQEQLPLFEMVIDEEDESVGFQLISIVDQPAIGIKGLAFEDLKSIKIEFKTTKEMAEQKKLAGPALIPDLEIDRRDPDGFKYKVVFRKEQIEKMVARFQKSGTNSKINFDHTNKMVDAYIEQSWIIKDKVYDTSRAYGFKELPIGTFFIVCKVEDESFWDDYVKEGFNGFSVEGMFGLKLIQLKDDIASEIERLLPEIDELIQKFKNISE